MNDDEMIWQKRCSGATCVEIAATADGAVIRDSKDPAGAWLSFDRDELREFFAAVRRGDFDDLVAEA